MLLLVAPISALAQEPDHEIHEELRTLLKQAEAAINAGNYAALEAVVTATPRITPIDQGTIATRAGVTEYFAKLFGPGKRLKSLNIKFTPDELTALSPDKTWGLVWGKGSEDYVLNDGRHYVIPTRWTAVVVKDTDGKWRIRSMHIGTNFLDNPILTEVEAAIPRYAAFAALAALVVGLGLGFWLGRRSRSAVAAV